MVFGVASFVARPPAMPGIDVFRPLIELPSVLPILFIVLLRLLIVVFRLLPNGLLMIGGLRPGVGLSDGLSVELTIGLRVGLVIVSVVARFDAL